MLSSSGSCNRVFPCINTFRRIASPAITFLAGLMLVCGMATPAWATDQLYAPRTSSSPTPGGRTNLVLVLVTLGLMLSLGACSHDSVTLPDDNYNLSPSSRTLAPVAVQRISGGVSSSDQMLSGGTTTIKGVGSYIVFDFGKEVGGILYCSSVL